MSEQPKSYINTSGTADLRVGQSGGISASGGFIASLNATSTVTITRPTSATLPALPPDAPARQVLDHAAVRGLATALTHTHLATAVEEFNRAVRAYCELWPAPRAGETLTREEG